MTATSCENSSSKSTPGIILPKKWINRHLVFAVSASLSYPLFFAFIFNINAEALTCALLHAFLSALFMYRVVSQTLLARKSGLGMPQVFILINALYFSASSIKYFEPQLYPGYVSDLATRFIFSVFALFILWILFEVLNPKQRSRYLRPSGPHHFVKVGGRRVWLLRIIILLILSGIIYRVIQGFYQGPGYLYQLQGDPTQLAIERTYLSTWDKISNWLSDLYPFMLPVFLSLYYRQRGGTLLIFISIIAMMSYSLVSGSRAIFFVFGMGLFVALVVLRDVGRMKFAWLIFSAPLMVAGISLIALTLSNRVSISNKEMIRWQLAYRFDLTDLAATFMKREGYIDLNGGLVSDALYRATPKVFMPNKFDAISEAYSQQLSRSGLNPYVDYNDTYFSVGVQIFGRIGFVLFPVVIVLFLYFIEKKIRKLFGREKGFVIMVCMFMLYSSAETSLDGLISAWRMLPVFIMFGVIVFKFIIQSHKLQSQNYNCIPSDRSS